MIGETDQLRAATRCGAKTRAGGVCQAPAMRNGRCHKHGGKVRLNMRNQNAVTHGRRREDTIQEKRFARLLIAECRDLLREIKASHRAFMRRAIAQLREERLNGQIAKGPQRVSWNKGIRMRWSDARKPLRAFGAQNFLGRSQHAFCATPSPFRALRSQHGSAALVSLGAFVFQPVFLP
jgi:hypothetical protein